MGTVDHNEEKSAFIVPSSVHTWFQECVELIEDAPTVRQTVFKTHYIQWCEDKKINVEAGHRVRFAPFLLALGFKGAKGGKVRGRSRGVCGCVVGWVCGPFAFLIGN